MQRKKQLMDKKKNGEKPKILITEPVKIGDHSTVFSVGESPNLKPTPVISTLRRGGTGEQDQIHGRGYVGCR